ncbi:hypothetical protein CkaCkLH20_07444 [Colletotrichum karsti]|uniref:Glucose-methanol-choline oxidoreductase C-terminal domain-containing protein n=1 Tax=Colletotrichum karsti TaxID=1095194 RepID=A0A9P6I2C5_9PEZI|nr:uncharacterized protein CkaCkLH20_07444 [Colletotrichum karsti]KAF9875178.1 hypothetical protein CkaCkLH20_07444 [Colletotrichum karsti]
MGSMPDREHLDEVDVLIVGSGPIGAVFARTLVSAGRSVVMIDVGDQGTRRIGDHRKNSVAVQKDISLFSHTVRASLLNGDLHPLSVSTNATDSGLEPGSWSSKPAQTQFLYNGQNPEQQASDNLPAAAASRVVGGMSGHWTNCTPRQNKTLERSDLFSDEEWNALYARAEDLFWTDDNLLDDSIRQQLVKKVLGDAFEDRGREIASMPMCGRRGLQNRDYVEWACTATILGDLAEPCARNARFELRANTQCVRLEMDPVTRQVELAQVEDLLENRKYGIKANKYVICAGAVLTAGILWNSGGLRETIPALGRYIVDQPMSFCQVLLDQKHIDAVTHDEYQLGWKRAVTHHKGKHPNDPLPLPFNDPDPQCYFPPCEDYPWHAQIHRDAFGYGQIPGIIDQRVVLDLRWYGYTKPSEENCVEFSADVTDGFGMPQASTPTFHFKMNEEDSDRASRMMSDMVDVAQNLGAFLPGAEPKHLPPGSAMHLCGTYRAGQAKVDEETGEGSVVDRLGRVWGQDDLVLGGCGVIPTQSACNPTITAAAFALAAADQIVEDLDGVKARKLELM